MPLDSFDDPHHLYFITASVIDWKPLFTEKKYAWVILDVFSFFRNKKEILLFAFVIMPSHIHAIIKPINIPIGKFLQSFGSLTAHKLIKMLRDDQRTDVLNTFHENRRDWRSNHSFWQEIFTENIFSQRFLEQKLEYIHQNPISKLNDSIENRSDFLFSSARFYDNGEIPIIEIDDISDYLMK